jgi:hypothetical protein
MIRTVKPPTPPPEKMRYWIWAIDFRRRARRLDAYLAGLGQGRRKPSGPAKALLIAIAHDPDAYVRAIAAWNAGR